MKDESNELVRKLRVYASVYKESPLGREVKGTVELLIEAADMIEKLLTNSGSRHRDDEWTYCGDGRNLPKKDGYYLVTLRGRGVDGNRIQKALFSEEFDYFLDYETKSVMAWQPLPAPYRK